MVGPSIVCVWFITTLVRSSPYTIDLNLEAITASGRLYRDTMPLKVLLLPALVLMHSSLAKPIPYHESLRVLQVTDYTMHPPKLCFSRLHWHLLLYSTKSHRQCAYHTFCEQRLAPSMTYITLVLLLSRAYRPQRGRGHITAILSCQEYMKCEGEYPSPYRVSDRFSDDSNTWTLWQGSVI